tara:strand:+ start:283 stop:627 length:345 start_codon:yes stop_codon:yes gene_type:complete
MNNMNHSLIASLLSDLKSAGLPAYVVEAFSNILQDQGYEVPVTGSKETPHQTSQLVEGLYYQRNRQTLDALIHVRMNENSGDWEYLYVLQKEYGYSEVMDSFLTGEDWTLYMEL